MNITFLRKLARIRQISSTSSTLIELCNKCAKIFLRTFESPMSTGGTSSCIKYVIETPSLNVTNVSSCKRLLMRSSIEKQIPRCINQRQMKYYVLMSSVISPESAREYVIMSSSRLVIESKLSISCSTFRFSFSPKIDEVSVILELLT